MSHKKKDLVWVSVDILSAWSFRDHGCNFLAQLFTPELFLTTNFFDIISNQFEMNYVLWSINYLPYDREKEGFVWKGPTPPEIRNIERKTF